MGQLAFANMKHENILANNIIKIGIYLPRILLLWIFNTSKIALLNDFSSVMLEIEQNYCFVLQNVHDTNVYVSNRLTTSRNKDNNQGQTWGQLL